MVMLMQIFLLKEDIMVTCRFIVDLYTKHRTKCNLPVENEIAFIKSDIKLHNPDHLFLYRFDEHKYCAIGGSHIQIQQISTPMAEILWHFYGHTKTDNELKQSIIDGLTYISTHQNIGTVDKHKLMEFMDNLQIQSNEQSGGGILWSIERTLKKNYPGLPSTLFTGLLEFIDLIITITAFIPGLQTVFGSELIRDMLVIFYYFLRFDIVGIASGLIALIPNVGNILGGIIKTSEFIIKYLIHATKYRRVNHKVNKDIKELTSDDKYLQYANNIEKAIKLGAKYDIIDAVKFGAKYRYDAIDAVRRDLANGYALLLTQYGDLGLDVAKLLPKYGQIVIDAVTLGAVYEEEAVKAVQRGTW